ncbi:hypothetical protein BDV06DRAFT_177068 [Aspergillus oleicola]
MITLERERLRWWHGLQQWKELWVARSCHALEQGLFPGFPSSLSYAIFYFAFGKRRGQPNGFFSRKLAFTACERCIGKSARARAGNNDFICMLDQGRHTYIQPARSNAYTNSLRRISLLRKIRHS